uniref:Retinoblastoma-binding protein n=1 Tax=Ciona intestinalis TaxID=7719 RepID=Q4H2W0_CIOIN|nr:Retinoblastoma-binding protein [Ciona intestinalis]BAE06667.1 Retinoblastoma-binding protein [Ciona intestinalis]|eukprot:NP_001072026.1 Retinoblastoma-binding protein [Ciona intestinalis]
MANPEKHHLSVGTEVSAKYRGAFCEAKIKSVKKNVNFRVMQKKDNKFYYVNEDSIKGNLKLGSTVEAQFPEQHGWCEGVIQSVRDKSIYTVEFDDGDVRTLSRGSLCLQGVRHYAESETLDHLPLTDPENFGTPVLNGKRKPKRKTPQSSSALDESEEHCTPDREPPAKRKLNSPKSDAKQDIEDKHDVDCDELRIKWLADSMMGNLVLVEPTDKRKHWYPAVVVNPMCYENYNEVKDNHFVIRSFKTGKIARVLRCNKLTRNNGPFKVEPSWKDVLDDAFRWEETGAIPDVWKTDIKDIFDEDEGEQKLHGMNDENHDFLEQLYKFMEDRGTPVNKTPVLGYKDLDLFMLYNLVQAKGGFHAVSLSTDWRDIYTELGIPKLTQAAGHHVKNAYIKYLLNFEEYMISFRQRNKVQNNSGLSKSDPVAKVKKEKLKSGRSSPPVRDDEDGSLRRTSRRRKVSECSSVGDSDLLKEIKRGRKSRQEDMKRDSDVDDASSTTGSEKSVTRGRLASEATSGVKKDRKRSNSGTPGRRKNVVYKIGDKLKVKYGKDSFKLYHAKVVSVECIEGQETRYFVHYAGWNSRHDEWIKSWQISSCVSESSTSASSSNSPTTTLKGKRPKTPVPFEGKLESESANGKVAVGSTTKEVLKSVTQALTFTTSSNDQEMNKEIISEVKKQEEKPKTRMRRRSTSSSTPPPAPVASTSTEKRALSEEKILTCQTSLVKSSEASEGADLKSNTRSTGRISPLISGSFPSSRRTSTRRSKSPAYLRESTLYGISKRIRTNSTTSASEETTSAETQTEQVLETDASSDVSKSARSSPSLDHQSSQSTSNDESGEKSLNHEQKQTQRKSDELREKLTDIKEENDSSDESEQKEDADEETQVEQVTGTGTDVCETSTSAPLPINEDVEEEQNEEGNSNIAEENGSESSNEEVDENPKSSPHQEPHNDLQGYVEPAIPDVVPPIIPLQAPSSSKVLVENTPPTTPEPSPDHFYEEQVESDNIPNIGSGSSSLSGMEINQSSPGCKDENKSEGEPKRKKRGRSGQSRRSSKADPQCENHDTESEEDTPPGGQCDSNAKGRRRINKRKAKPKPAPPTAPPPVMCEELALMTPEQRIAVLQAKLSEMRTVYQQLKQEVQSIDRKRKRAKRREQEVAGSNSPNKILPSPMKREHSDESTSSGENTAKDVDTQSIFVSKT